MTPWNEFDRDAKLSLFDKISIRWEYRIRPALNPRRIFNRFVRFPYQKLTRGFSDKDMWNADMYLAGQIAGTLDWIVNNGMGVAMSYYHENDVDNMVERRDKDYLYYRDVFSEYQKNGLAHDEAWKNEFGGVLDSDMQDALQWLSKHFQELWD